MQRVPPDARHAGFGAVLSLLRIICNPDHYIPFRVMLGLLQGVGLATTNRIAHKVVAANINYRDLFSSRCRPPSSPLARRPRCAECKP
jgi:hypothetical protein